MSEAAFERLVQKLEPGGRLLQTWALKGGVSAQVTALELAQPNGQTKTVIVRQPGPVDLKHNPHIAADEYRLLQITQAADLPTPTPYLVDETAQVLPSPYIVMEYIEGEPDFAPADPVSMAAQLAALLARIHAVVAADLSFLPDPAAFYTQKLQAIPAQLDDSLSEGPIRAALQAVWPLAPLNPLVLLHGDFWPGNLLWRAGQLVAIIDWEDAATGDPLADVGNTRLELLWAFGIEAMQRFTEHYQTLTRVNLAHLPYWDLCAALRPASKLGSWGLEAETEVRMREQHRWFVNQALQVLALH